MLTKGIIKSINYESNEGTIRVPLFETASQHEEFVSNAVFSIVPGIYNSYKVGDVVWVEFENNSLETAVILGKLYVDSKEENNSFRGAVSIESLNVSKNATLPVSTTLSWDAKDDTVVGVDGDFSTYKNIGDILKRVKTTEDAVSDAQVQIINNGEEVGARVSKVEEDNVEHAAELKLHSKEIGARVTKESPKEYKGFGWSMDENGIKFTSALGNKEEGATQTDVLTVDANGAIVTGKLTVKDKAKPTPNIIFEADPFGSDKVDPHVKIGGFDVDHNKLSIGTIGSNNSVALISDNNIEPVAIAKSSKKNDWRIVAGENFGVDSSGKTYMSDINIDGIEFDTSHSEPGKFFRIEVSAKEAEETDNWVGVKFTASSLNGPLDNDTDINITYLDSKNQQLLTTITILAGESEGSIIIEDAKTGEGDFSWDPQHIDSTLGDFLNAYGYFNDKNKMHCTGYSFDLVPGGQGGNWDRAKLKTVSWYRTTWELINNNTMTKKLVALNNDKWATNNDVVRHAIDKHEFTKIHSIIEQWNSTKRYGIIAKTSKSNKVIASGNANGSGLSASLTYISEYGGNTTNISISRRPGNAGTCIINIKGETIVLNGSCKQSGTVYISNLSGKSSTTGKSYNLQVSRFLIAPIYDLGGGIGPGSSIGNNNLQATLTETYNDLSKIETTNPITINPQFSLIYVDDSNEDVIYLYSRISNVPQIDVKNDTEQSASYRFIPLSFDPMITSIDLSKSDFIDFSLESGESVGARYFIFDDDKLNMFVYGKNYSWLQAKQTIDIEIAANTKRTTVEKTVKLEHAPQEILGIDIDDSKATDLIWSSVHSYVENDEIKINLISVTNNESTAKHIYVIVNYAWQQEI